MASLYLSAAHKSSGKTTLSIGLCAALVDRGLQVQPFKKGPDYIDPIWLGMATGKPCYNLDFFVAGKQETIDDYYHRSQSADIAIIEGNKGLHDGLDLDGSNSNAALAKSLKSPVIMVVDARGTMRGIAPLLIGYQVFDADVHIAGVIANMTGGRRHESKLRDAVEYYTDIPFLGALDKHDSLALFERHLGLIPGYEDPQSKQKISTIADAVRDNIDLDKMLEISQLAGKVDPASTPINPKPDYQGIKIGIARDRAFGFYYPGDLEKFQQVGAQLIEIDTLNDTLLPVLDGLFIGGGFPERHAAALEANNSLRNSIKIAIDNGLPTYAECGGLMYLTQNLEWNGEIYDMAGVISGQTKMHDRPCGRGYVKLAELSANALWSSADINSKIVHAHEFHYSSIEGLSDSQRFAYAVHRGHGINQQCDGLVYKNLLASYSHFRNTSANPWVSRFLNFVKTKKDSQENNLPGVSTAH